MDNIPVCIVSHPSIYKNMIVWWVAITVRLYAKYEIPLKSARINSDLLKEQTIPFDSMPETIIMNAQTDLGTHVM